jgi:hypothetical protein
MSLSLNCPAPQNKGQMLKRLQEILKAGWLEMPSDIRRYKGTGGPGNYLEDLLGLTSGNKDIADCVGWEVKYHTPKTSLITLFHKEPEPAGIMRYMVSKYGWKDKLGRLSFRHTIHGQSDRFIVIDDAGTIIVRPVKDGNDPVPSWTHDTLLNVAGGKLRRLVAMAGQRKGQTVKFNSAVLYEKMHLTQLAQDLVSGRIAIDFDVREMTAGSKGLRNHGTKFRVSPKDLHRLYFKETPLKLS